MDPEDKIDVTPGGWSISYDDTLDYTESSTEVTDGKFTVNYNNLGNILWSTSNVAVAVDVAANDNDFIVTDIFSDTTFGVTPTKNESSIYTSYEQRGQHEKYPALQKAWEDYLAMYALTKGEPPIVD